MISINHMDYIGYEIEEKYISLINNRLNAVNEGKWF